MATKPNFSNKQSFTMGTSLDPDGDGKISVGAIEGLADLADKKSVEKVAAQLTETVKEVNGVKPTNGKITLPTMGLDTATSDKIQKSAEAVSFYNYAWNGNPETTDFHSFTLADGVVDTTLKEIRFTPTARLGQLTYTGIRHSNLKLNNQIYVRLAIKCASGTKNNINIVAGYGANTSSKPLPPVTTEYQYVSVIFDKNNFVLNLPNLKIVDYDNTGFVEISIKDIIIIDLTEQYGDGNEPTKQVIDSTIQSLKTPYFEKLYNTGIVSKAESAAVADRLTTPIDKPLYVTLINGEIRVISKYNGLKDIIYVLGKKGVNNIFDFKEIRLVDNKSISVSKNTNAGTQYALFTSDNFGPHVIRAVNNGNGDQPDSYNFTGGNHGYDNTGGTTNNSATGRTMSLVVKVEGRTVEKYDGQANYIEIKWTNMVQGSNTKKVDGTGREILKETYIMTFNGIKWEVEYSSEMLEDVTYSLFYGLQFQTLNWSGGIFYHTSPNKKWLVNKANASASNDETTKTCNRMTVKDDSGTHFVDIDMDTRFGIGNREYVTTSVPNAFEQIYNKCYWNLIKDKSLTANTILTFRGSYKFYSA